MEKEMMIALVRYEKMLTAISLDPINKDPDLLDVHGPYQLSQAARLVVIPVTASVPLINQLFNTGPLFGSWAQASVRFFEEK